MTTDEHGGWLGTSSVLVALAISAVGATFR
jgi:hypothetical protein